MTTVIRSLTLAPRGLFYDMYSLMETLPNACIPFDEKEIADHLQIKVPHFSKTLKILLRKRIFVRTKDGLRCPYLDHATAVNKIRRTYFIGST